MHLLQKLNQVLSLDGIFLIFHISSSSLDIISDPRYLLNVMDSFVDRTMKSMLYIN